jgi:uncharacterized protein (TIRG00374 family)
LKRWQLVLGLAVSTVFLYIALNGLKLEEVWRFIQSADLLWLVPGVIVYFGAVAARTWRWDYLLRPVKRIPLRALFPVVVIGYMGNNIYPFRAGELVRAYVLKRKLGVSVSASLATVFIERIFDGVTMLLFVFLALPLFARYSTVQLPEALQFIVIAGSLAFFGALIAFLVLAAHPDKATRVFSWFLHRFVPHRFHDGAHGLLNRFQMGLSSLRSGRDVLKIFFISLVIWLTETLKYWFVLHAFPGMLQGVFADPLIAFYALMLMNGIVNLATTLPSAPGYVGTFDTPGIVVLTAFGIQRAVATAYTLVLHAALWLPITALGAFYMLRESLSWQDFSRASARTTDDRRQPTDHLSPSAVHRPSSIGEGR